jgi:CRISPR-associated protein Cas2
MAGTEMLRVIVYDVSSDRVRARVAEILESVGARVQMSVFEARLNHAAAARVMEQIGKLVDRGDNVRLYTIPDTMIARCEAKGGAPIADAGRFWLV